jgi:hypothetical protein
MAYGNFLRRAYRAHCHPASEKASSSMMHTSGLKALIVAFRYSDPR